MRGEVARDLSKSAKAFKEIVWPEIAHWCRGGELIPVEGVTDSRMASLLDQLAGIDAWQVVDGEGVRGIASRVQFGASYRSFTIRRNRVHSTRETEWQKRRRSHKNQDAGWLYPTLTVQAYISRDGKLLYACMARTSELFAFADDAYRGVVW